MENRMSTFDPTKGTRLAPAWNTALTHLEDGDWHDWTTLVAAMTDATDIQPVTASNLLHDGVRNGTFERQGEHRSATRQVRLNKTSR